MKILMIGQLVGGLDIYNRNTISYADKDVEYVIVRGKDDKHEPIYHNGAQVREIPISLYRSLNPFKDLKALCQAVKAIKNEKPDVVHCHSAKGGIIGRIASFLCGVKCLYTPHAFSFFCTPNSKSQWVYKTIEKLTRFKTYLLACSESERKVGIETIGYKPERALCWTNAVPEVKASCVPTDDDSQGDIVKSLDQIGSFISYIGRPSYQKNLFFLINVVDRVHALHPEIKFVLFGVGYHSPDLEDLKAQISTKKLQDVVILVPWLSHDCTMNKLVNSLFYITCSRYEGLPLSLIEAMSMGKAIVASDVVGNCDCVEDRVNGRLLPLQEDLYVAAIIELIEHPELCQVYGQKSREYFEQKFLIDHRINELMAIYRKVASF